jgi:hypothetical protein
MRKIKYCYTLIVCIILFFGGCKKGEEENSFKYTSIKLDSIKPGELKKIDDYPFYYLNYDKDYGFDKYLVQGISKNTSPMEYFSEGINKWACTCFAATGAKDSVLFGRNFDFFHKSCLLLHTSPPNAFSSYSMVDLYYCGFSENVTYQELIDNPDKLKKAPYLPLDGVNEKGVAIGLMAVPNAEPPYDEGKVTFYDLALIRLVLDYAENTDHAINLLKSYNYKATDPPVHFLIADKQGNSAIIEYVEKDIKITRNTEPYLVSTNFIVYNSGAPINVTCDRYNKVYSKLNQNLGIISKIESMELLNQVSQDITMWSLVYDLSSFNTIFVAVDRNYNKVYNFKK